jgi:hypothetical protein
MGFLSLNDPFGDLSDFHVHPAGEREFIGDS